MAIMKKMTIEGAISEDGQEVRLKIPVEVAVELEAALEMAVLDEPDGDHLPRLLNVLMELLHQ